jgi:hypothetical protein
LHGFSVKRSCLTKGEPAGSNTSKMLETISYTTGRTSKYRKHSRRTILQRTSRKESRQLLKRHRFFTPLIA